LTFEWALLTTVQRYCAACDSLIKRRCYDHRFVAPVGENWHPVFFLCTGVPQWMEGSQLGLLH